MPRATARFPFEFKIMSWAVHFSKVMTGENRCMLIILDSDGAVRQLFFGEDEYHYDLEMWETLRQSNQCWLFYHPFEGPVYTYMEWQDLQRNTIERLMGGRFEDTDFAGIAPSQSPQATNECVEFPISWKVMF
jgi:hypothetical protein